MCAKFWHGCLKTAQGPIRASLGGHVQQKRDLLERVLEARLDTRTVWKPRDLRRAHDAAIAELDARFGRSPVELGKQIRLLETIVDLDIGSARLVSHPTLQGREDLRVVLNRNGTRAGVQ